LRKEGAKGGGARATWGMLQQRERCRTLWKKKDAGKKEGGKRELAVEGRRMTVKGGDKRVWRIGPEKSINK